MAYEWLRGGKHPLSHGGSRPKPLLGMISGISPKVEKAFSEADKVFSKALDEDPKKRYPSIKEFAEDFTKACQGIITVTNFECELQQERQELLDKVSDLEAVQHEKEALEDKKQAWLARNKSC